MFDVFLQCRLVVQRFSLGGRHSGRDGVEDGVVFLFEDLAEVGREKLIDNLWVERYWEWS